MTETYPPEINGVALTLAHLVNGLRQQGHTVSVVRPRQQDFDGPSCSYDAAAILVPGFAALTSVAYPLSSPLV